MASSPDNVDRDADIPVNDDNVIDDDAKSITSVTSVRSVASARALDKRAKLAALQQQRLFAEKQQKIEAARLAADFELKQLELDRQVAATQAELAVYEQADSDASDDPEVTFPKLRRDVSVSAPVTSGDVDWQMPTSRTADDGDPAQSLLECNNHTSPCISVPAGNQCNTQSAASGNGSTDVPQSSMMKLIDSMCKSVQRTQLPKLELSVFRGDPLEFQQWSASFRRLVEDVTSDPSHRLHYLMQHTVGDARTLISAYSLSNTAEAYQKAVQELVREYGDPYVLARAYLKKIESWPQIKYTDISGMQSFTTFLKKCRGSMTTLKHLRQLDTDLYLQKIVLKLPTAMQVAWRKYVCLLEEQRSEITFSGLVDFIDRQVKIAKHPVFSQEALCEADSKVKHSQNTATASGKHKTVSSVCVTNVGSDGDCKQSATVAAQVVSCVCPLCSGNHDLDDCAEYLNKSVEDRHQFLISKRLCFACYGKSSKNHNSRSCRKRRKCKQCGKQHPTGLHGYRFVAQLPKVESNPDSSDRDETLPKVCTCATDTDSDCVAMNVVMVKLCHESNMQNEIVTYAALDSMSSACFLSNSVYQALGVEGESTEITIKTMNDEQRQATSVMKGICVRAVYGSEYVSIPKAYVQDSIPVDITDIPSHATLQCWPHLKHLVAEIPERNPDVPIGLLIGVNCPKALEPVEIIPGTGASPFAVRTLLGWSVSGPLSSNVIGRATRPSVICNRTSVQECYDNGLKDLLLQMYEHDFTESKYISSCMSQDDNKFLSVMEAEVKFEDGHYELPLPFRCDEVNLPNNRAQAVQRVNVVKKRFEADLCYKRDYTTFMNNIIDKGYAQLTEPSTSGWYVPHHGVYHPKKPGKIRVVFDCSSKCNGKSLNDQLLSGPDLTNSLVAVLIRFRQEKIAVMADVESMFYQVRVAECHRKFLQFLWWPNGDTNADIKDYQMTVHLFGATSSPSCANFALRKTARDNEQRFGTEAAEALRKSFYVDDLLKSVDSIPHSVHLMSAVKQMCAAGGFKLTKFVSNNQQVIDSIPPEDRAENKDSIDLTQSMSVQRALGVYWCVASDCLEFRIVLQDKPLTRRRMLSTISSIYDPLGLASPFLLKGRKLLQSLSNSKLDWDDPVTDEHHIAWQRWRSQLPLLENIKISRCFKPDDFGDLVHASLHHFSDASQSGYGECSYVRLVDVTGRVHCSLVIGKSRVSPLKPVTVPRLELTAATVAVKVGRLLESEMQYENMTSTYWTDSKAVLGFINNSSRRFHMYVANRVQLIHENSSVQSWKYVPTDSNPADDTSRGLNCATVQSDHRWFTGPDFLWNSEYCWPQFYSSDYTLQDMSECKKTVHVTVLAENTDLVALLEKRTSDWFRLKKMVVIWSRFIQFVSKRNLPVPGGTSTVAELEEAETVILKSVQKRSFPEEVQHLSSACLSSDRSRHMKKLKKSSRIYSLDPMMDSHGLIRVGGRLRKSSLEEGQRHPIILDKHSIVTKLIVLSCHRAVQHGGRGFTINEVRSRGFWIIACNSTVRKIIHECVVCRKLRGMSHEQKMADLPADRLNEAPPFTYCAVDMFGPFVIKEGRKELKRYGCLFTCLACRAIHIETANSLDTSSFINALRRFIARRGSIRQLRSDNGTNFVGAERELNDAWKNISSKAVDEFLSHQGADHIQWKHNPPTASHMGGVWERQIRSVRAVLSSLLRQHGHLLDDELFRTLLTEVEAVVNGRPLTVDNLSDPLSPCPLSPNQLLTMKSKLVLPPAGVFERPDLYCRRRWRRVQHIADEFWNRWKKEYLASLQPRHKNVVATRNFKVGDIVLVKDENTVRNLWPMARIVSVRMDDKQECVRSVFVRFGTRDLSDDRCVRERPVNKLILLIEAD